MSIRIGILGYGNLGRVKKTNVIGMRPGGIRKGLMA